jgi:hypothetical protein
MKWWYRIDDSDRRLILIMAGIVIGMLALTFLIIADEMKDMKSDINFSAGGPYNGFEWVTLSDGTECVIIHHGSHSGIAGVSCKWGQID